MSADTATTSPMKLPGLFARFVKFEHSVFALPFAYAGAFLAFQQIPYFARMFWITVVMVAARSLAMGLNRVIDHEIDARNPRTASREIPAGTLTLPQGIAFCGLSLAVLAIGLYQLPSLTWYLSPIVVAAFVIYPYTKRFTSLCHVFLGATIGLAPVGAWVAVAWELPWQPFLLMGVVTFWIAGFDIIYACLDLDFDRREGIHSLPVSLGIAGALRVTRVFHLLSVALMLAVGMVLELGLVYYIGVGVVAMLLAYENAMVSARDLSRVNTAFMTMNGIISVVYAGFVTADILVK
ncbi:MAG: UbiA-like polyprenyltransferase [Thermoleophilia bacterium]